MWFISMITASLSSVCSRANIWIASAICLCAATLVPLPAKADLILSVSGSSNTGETLSADQAAAAAFSLSAPATNVTITAPVTCLGCTGGIWLQQNSIGPGTSMLDTLFGDAFPGVTSITLSSLAAGTYFLIYSVDTGTAIWQGSNPTSVTADQSSVLTDFLATSTDPYSPLSNFSTVFGVGLNLIVTGDRTNLTAPEPGSLALFLVALVVIPISAVRRMTTPRAR